MTSGGSPRTAGVLLGASVVTTAVVRALTCLYTGFLLGPMLGGLTGPLVYVLPGGPDVTGPIVVLAELVAAVVVAVLTIKNAVGLFREEPLVRGGLTRLTRWLLGLSVLHVTTVLGVLPFYERAHVPAVLAVVFAALSLAIMAMVVVAQRAARLWAQR